MGWPRESPATLAPQALTAFFPASGFHTPTCSILGQELTKRFCVSDPRFLGAVACDGAAGSSLCFQGTFPGLAFP